MTKEEIAALRVHEAVGFKASPEANDPIKTGKVTQNGPRLDPEGNPLPNFNDLLVVQLDDSTVTVSWEPVYFPNGIPQLVPAPAKT